jgi:U3 small nucleolar RNA-associated protein 18
MERFKLSPCGRWMGLVGSSRKGGGVINVLDAETLQWIAQARIEGRGGVADFAWWADGDGMCIASKGGEIGEWDMRQKEFVGRWSDEGAVGTTTIALGSKSGRKGLGGNRWVVVGSSSGIVNIYDRRAWSCGAAGIPENPKPTKTFEQLVTATSHLVFSPDGQILAMGSRWKRDALRLSIVPFLFIFSSPPKMKLDTKSETNSPSSILHSL